MINRTVTTKLMICLSIIFSILIIDQSYAQELTPHLLWPDNPPDISAIVHLQPEKTVNREQQQNSEGLNRSIANVSIPTYTVHRPPRDKQKDTAVIIFPGGGYSRVVIDKEGFDIAKRLNQHGLTGIVVKYRTLPVDKNGKRITPTQAMRDAMLNDGLRSVRIIRSRAKELGVNPNRIGVMGFSAGGHLAASVATHFDSGNSNASDPFERISSRPDFAALIYPAISDNIVAKVGNSTPPAFFTVAGDDTTTPAEKSLQLLQAMRSHDVSTEIHIYAKGGHGFGLGVDGGPVTSWPERFIDWLKIQEML